MASKKFKIDGREYESYQLSNEQIVRLVKENEVPNENLTADERAYLVEKIIDRFESTLCPRKNEGETNDDVFARFFGDFVNGVLCSKEKVAERMCREHRYLQNEMFKVCLAYIKKLAENYEKGYYDGRNEYAAKTSSKIIEYFNSTNYPY